MFHALSDNDEINKEMHLVKLCVLFGLIVDIEKDINKQSISKIKMKLFDKVE